MSPDRIPLVLVERAWRRVPDQRLGQLLENVGRGRDLFHVEDDVLLFGDDEMPTYIIQPEGTFVRSPGVEPGPE